MDTEPNYERQEVTLEDSDYLGQFSFEQPNESVHLYMMVKRRKLRFQVAMGFNSVVAYCSLTCDDDSSKDDEI